MAKKKAVDPEDIQLVNVGTFKSMIEVGFNLKELNEKFHAYHFCFDQKTALNIKGEAVRIRLSVNITGRDKDKQDIGAKCEFGIEFHFRITDFEGYISYATDKTPIIEKGLGYNMLAIAYSTARGIIYSKTEATVLSGILLPVIDPSHLMNQKFEMMSMIL